MLPVFAIPCITFYEHDTLSILLTSTFKNLQKLQNSNFSIKILATFTDLVKQNEE